jgi:mannose-6-phosphate isomerase-like protein (cupin superfamily)
MPAIDATTSVIMKIIKAKEVKEQKSPHGIDVKKLLDSANVVVSQITLRPGEALKKHVTPVDVFFFVLQGKGVVEIGDEEVEVGPDTLIDSPARIMHGWRNTGKDDLRFLVVKAPRPTEPTIMACSECAAKEQCQ